MTSAKNVSKLSLLAILPSAVALAIMVFAGTAFPEDPQSTKPDDEEGSSGTSEDQGTGAEESPAPVEDSEPPPPEPAEQKPPEEEPKKPEEGAPEQKPPEAEPKKAEESPLDRLFDGYISFKYRVRNAREHGPNDQDFYAYLFTDIGDKEQDSVTATLAGRFSLDLDSDLDERGFYVFDSIDDTRNHATEGRLYRAYVDVWKCGAIVGKNKGTLEKIRVGRQQVLWGDGLYFDGVRFDSNVVKKLANLQVSVYGGVPVHLYDSNHSGDGLVGVGVELKPAKKTTARVDWQYVNDNEGYFGDNDDNLISLNLWQGVTENIKFHTQYSVLNRHSRDVVLDATFYCPKLDMTVQGSFMAQFSTIRDHAIDFDPYYQAVFQYYPYYQKELRISKDFCEYFGIETGVTVRDLKDEDDEGAYNHEFRRYYVSPYVRDWPWKGTTMTVTGEWWGTADDDTSSVGGEFAQELGKGVKIALGTSYAVYKYNLYANTEHDDVRTGYIRGDWEVKENLKFQASFEVEDDDFDTYHTFTLGCTIDF